jgi:hypothetical protein
MGKAAQRRRDRKEQERQQRNLNHARNVAGLSVVKPSQPQAQAVWPSPAQREASLSLLEKFDGMAGLRNGLRAIASVKNEWAGIPMPLEGERLVIEPSYPKAAELMAIGQGKDDEHDEPIKIRNSFFSSARQCIVHLIEEDGKVTFALEPAIHHFMMDLQTLGCADAWGIEQESNAVHTLAGLVRHRQFKQYMLTGMFIESSARSHLSYVFRRLKPTVALDVSGPSVNIRCAMCLHPIGYYSGTWAGAMTPTDDVIAHLMMMRGDEPMFWRRANQIPAYLPQAGL